MLTVQAKSNATTAVAVIPRLILMVCLFISSGLAVAETDISVFKNPNCGCCEKWVTYLEGEGFSPTVTDSDSMSDVKQKHGIAPQYQSCHTGVVDGYVFEGHVPAPIMKRFLEEKPADAIGLSVPGMPVGSPGMEVGHRHDDYDVLLLKKDGSSEVYEHVSEPVDSAHSH
ncbi:DUF411 domain-containing protein [Pseudomaricurvus sp.]|uniref:DUF411 domain-containing protein n=1 Tax=Pseudomaricurvus sp. TaxID=2004510 RepID=UPI003F6C0513